MNGCVKLSRANGFLRGDIFCIEEGAEEGRSYAYSNSNKEGLIHDLHPYKVNVLQDAPRDTLIMGVSLQLSSKIILQRKNV